MSPVYDQATDEAGNGIVGFTIHFSDSTFENIIYPYSYENKALVLSSIDNLRQSYLAAVSAITTKQTSKQKNKFNKEKTKGRKS